MAFKNNESYAFCILESHSTLLSHILAPFLDPKVELPFVIYPPNKTHRFFKSSPFINLFINIVCFLFIHPNLICSSSTRVNSSIFIDPLYLVSILKYFIYSYKSILSILFSTWETDQFLVNAYVGCKVVRPLSRDGVPY